MLLEIYNAVTGVLFHLLEPSNLGITGVSIFTVYLSSLRALEHERFIAETKDDSLQVTLSSLQAAIFPFVASIFLIFMFYFFSSVSLIYISMAVFTSWAAVAFAFAPLASVTPSWQALSGVSPVKHDSKVAAGNCRTQMVFGSKARTAALCSLSALPVIAWALTGHWLLNNILGCCLCATIISFIRLPNMKICTILLGCLLLYDVFWVFFSSTLFGNNVMLHVAQQKSSNPVHAAAKAMNLPVASGIAPKLDPPVKLMFPASPLRSSTRASYSALGLGDVAIPGMVLALAACIDQKQSAAAPSSRPPRYLTAATAGYAAGMVAASAAAALTGDAQPALLYLVPAVLLPVFAVARRRGQLDLLWSGPRLLRDTNTAN
mmetsp:Transcript_21825/g.52147  ORF Transcript_21825/g.52147 Transcript_21825/m.52147 type:complete len:376 (-) Transcript_21825:195-1322(-)